MKILQEFREFAVRGNVIDMAVGVIIGTAFGRIVTSLVNDVIMPPIGMLLGGVHFGDLSLTLEEATVDSPEVVLAWGRFLQTVTDFLIIALVVFLLVRLVNRMNRRAEAAVEPPVPSAPSKQEVLLTEIRDLLARD